MGDDIRNSVSISWIFCLEYVDHRIKTEGKTSYILTSPSNMINPDFTPSTIHTRLPLSSPNSCTQASRTQSSMPIIPAHPKQIAPMSAERLINKRVASFIRSCTTSIGVSCSSVADNPVVVTPAKRVVCSVPSSLYTAFDKSCSQTLPVETIPKL